MSPWLGQGVRGREGNTPMGSKGSGTSQDSLLWLQQALEKLRRSMARTVLYSKKILWLLCRDWIKAR